MARLLFVIEYSRFLQRPQKPRGGNQLLPQCGTLHRSRSGSCNSIEEQYYCEWRTCYTLHSNWLGLLSKPFTPRYSPTAL